MTVVILTGKEIRDMAKFAGFDIGTESAADDELLETEYELSECPADGVTDDDGTNREHYRYVLSLAEYPEEGVYPLGDPIMRSQNANAKHTIHPDG